MILGSFAADFSFVRLSASILTVLSVKNVY